MELVKLNNGLLIPTIGYGTFPQKEILEDNVPIAYNVGYKLVDTSDNYLNEQFVGKGLSKLKTDDMIVVSKFSQPLRTHELEKCFNETRDKLGRIDLYLMHWPFPYLWEKEWRMMEELYLKGAVKGIGVCNFDEGYLKQLLKICRVKPLINQFERHPLFQQAELVKMCKDNDIQVMSYSPVARMNSELHEHPTLKSLSEKYGKSINQIILRWHIDTNCIPIPASSSKNHIRENFDIFDFHLSEKEIESINAMETGRRIRFNPRTRFNKEQKRIFAKQRMKMEIKKILGKKIWNIAKGFIPSEKSQKFYN